MEEIKKRYILPSVRVGFVSLANLMDQSVPVGGTTDAMEPEESKQFYNSFDDFSDEE